MRRFIFAVLMTGISVFVVSQSTVQPREAGTEQEVKAAVARCLLAGQKGDFSTLTNIIADDFVGTTFDGKLISKDDIVPTDGTPSFPSAAIEDLEVRTLGDTAVAIGAFVFDQKDMGRLRFTEVWTKRSGTWQLVVAHLSRG